MYKPNECPYGDCESNYVIGVGGKIYDCEVCQQVHIIKKYAENKKMDYEWFISYLAELPEPYKEEKHE